MPGISLIYDENGIEKFKDGYKNILGGLNFLKHHKSYVLKSENHLFVGCNKYDDYPIENFETEEFSILLEGKIYNKDLIRIKEDIANISNLFSVSDYSSHLTKWLKETDGDYIIYFIGKNNGLIYVINDIFGRLPLYYHKINGGIIISRYLRFIMNVENTVKFNMLGVSQFLLLGYMLGEHTILENVLHLRPGSLITCRNGDAKVEVIHKFNFEIKKHKNIKFNKNINSLSLLFKEACINRFKNNSENILAISGGLDSRAVVACMNTTKLPFKALTMKYESGYTVPDTKIGGDIASLLNLDWEPVNIPVPIGFDVYELLKIKEGMNSLFTVGILPFYKIIQEKFGSNIHYFTGDNGDKLIFTIDRPIPKFKDINQLAGYIIAQHAIIPMQQVTRLTGIEKLKVKEDMMQLLLSYPENDLIQKYIHFRIHEKPFKFAYQGEDRHRNYFWNVSPYWSIQFFDHLMNCSDESKIRHKTFRALIESYSKDVMKLEYTNFKSSITSIKGKLFMLFVYYVYSHLPVKIKKMIKPSFFEGDPKLDSDSPILICIHQILQNSELVKQYFKNVDLDYIDGLRKIAVFHFLTVLSTIEELGEKKSTLSEFLEVQFK